jgi:hypothetical protein
MKKLILLIIVASLVFCVNATAFQVVISNQSDESMTLRLNWWDHDMEHYGPVNIHTGEYEPKKISVLEYDYKGHYYSVDVNAAMWSFTEYIELEYDDESPPQTISLVWDGCKARHEMK